MSQMPAKTGAETLQRTLASLLQRDPRAIIAGETRDGLGGSRSRLVPPRPDQLIELPIAERGALGFALGLALGGRPVLLEVASLARLRAAIEPLAEAGAIARSGEFAVPLVLRVPHGAQNDGLHIELGSWLLDLPGISVVCPSSAGQLSAWITSGMAGHRPLVILESAALYGGPGAEIGEEAVSTRVARAPGAVLLAAAGGTLPEALAAADLLASEGIEAGVLEIARLSPLDEALIGEQTRRCGRLVVVHPGDEPLAERVQAAAIRGAFWSLEAPLHAASTACAQPSRAIAEAARYTLTA